MIYAKVDAQGRETIQTEMRTTTDAKWYRRLKVIDLSSQGQTATELAQMFDLSAATIRRYIHLYNDAGLTGLRPAYSRGRPPLLNWTQAQWQDVLAQSPANMAQLNTAAQNWTQTLLRQYLETYHEVKVTQTTISNALRRVGIRWRRAKRRMHSPDPLYVVKRQRVDQLRQLALAGGLTSQSSARRRSDEPPKSAYLAFLDSTDLHWNPDIGSTYGLAGKQLKVDSPGLENPWYALFGSLIFPSGEGLYTIHHRKRAAELLEHLQLLIDLEPGAFWFVILDNASAHTTAAVHAFEQQHLDRLELVYLPTYSPHLNLIERLWQLMRSQVTRNRFYDSLSALADVTVNWLDQLPFGKGEDHFTVTFDPGSGHLLTLEAHRYREAADEEKTLWRNKALGWRTFHGIQIPSPGSATWLDEGKPWAVFTVEDVAYNVDVSGYIRASGI